MASKFTTAEGKPTRHTLTSHDIADIQHHTVYLTFTPEEGEDISAFLHPSNVYDLMEDHLEMIEGILSFPGVLGQPEEFLVVCKPSETFSDLLRIAMGTCVFEKEKHGFEGRYQLHAQVLFDLKETRAEFVNMCEGHLFSCLTTGSTFEGDYLWEANSTFILTSTPHKDPLKRWQSTLTDLTPEKMAEVLDLVIKVATEKGIPLPKPGNGTPTPTPQPSEPQNGGGLPQPGIGGGGAPQPGGHGRGGRGGSGQNGSGRGQLGSENPSTPSPGNNQDHGQNNQNRPQQFQQRRGPFCFHCEEVDPQNKTTHWARQCELLKAIRQQAHKIAEQNRGTNLENL